MLQTVELSTLLRPGATTNCPRKNARKLVSGVLSQVEFSDFLKEVIWHFSDGPSQNAKCMAAAHFIGVDVATVHRWMTQTTSPKARDFWPLAFAVLLGNLPIPVQHQVMAAIAGMARR